MMTDVSTNPNVIEACTRERLEVLSAMSATIKTCEKSLNDYLEQKKKNFPRFYFLSNASLLTILSNGTNPPKVCEFLGDCFDGLKTIVFAPPKSAAELPNTGVAMLSKDNERIDFSEQFHAEGAVENWLSKLEFWMRKTLYEILEHAKSTSEMWDQGEKPREDWVRDYCAQVALLTTQIVWTEDITRAFDELLGGSESAMKDAYKVIETRIDNLIKKVRGKLDFLERNKIINIITIDVHGRDVVEKFVTYKVQEPEAFAWQSQLKFYWDNKESDMASRQKLRFPWEESKEKYKCIIKIVDWFRFYSYEYVGNSLRLVVTPLTDRCYITLTQALNLTMGGAPAGPAGTGKTETTKDLGRGVGLPVMVFNCSDQMSKDSMAQIFMGLAQSGAWGCFDEFNRISLDVLSVVSSQVSFVLDALKEKKTKFAFMEEGELLLVDTVGFFITMNPGYAGRSELPENLKALFRSCAMVVPEIVLICENMLMSEGFSTARALSRKFVTLYDLSKELLSKQKHYDWGLRAVKSVLRQAGGLKRSDPDIPEDPLLMRALRDFNLPKIVTDDRQIFLDLIGDLFPKVECDTKPDLTLRKVIHDTAKNDMGLIPEELFITKIVQLIEILEVRHCCFVIGPPGSGKTTVWRTLAKSLNNKGEECEYDTLNPKAVTADELFGYYTKSREWKNGVLSVIMTNQGKCLDKYKESQVHKFIILDGDIDPMWIESLNTVMDDNKVLTLVSNDRIPLSNAMRLLFEVSNLKNATLATVSRAGVLFINDNDIGWMPYMNSWLERSEDMLNKRKNPDLLEENMKIPIDDIGKSVFYRCFQTYIEQNQEIHKVHHIAPMVELAKVKTICTILDALLKEHTASIRQLKEEDQKMAYEALFVFAGMWAIGGSIGGGQDDEKDQKEFNSIWKGSSKVKFPDQGLLMDYFYEPAKQQWTLWSSVIDQYQPPEFGESINFQSIFVSTMHTTRVRYILDIHQADKKPVLFIGSAGSGKTAVVKSYLNSTKPEKVTHQTMNFNSFTDSMALQKNIWSLVDRKSGRTYGSATNKTLIYFIDDMNMPYVEEFGTQAPIALLRQIIDYASIFNREQLEERFFLQDLLFMGCLNPKSGSFTVNLRLQRHFSIISMYTPSTDTIKTVYGSILDGHLSNFDQSIYKLSEKLIEATILIFNRLLRDTRFSPSAKKFHYMFNLRELSHITEGLMLSTPAAYRGAPEKLIKLWVHECKRVFEDRMISDEDIKVFRDYLKDSLVKNFGDEHQDIVYEGTGEIPPLVYTGFISAHYGNEKSYVGIQNIAELKKVLEEKLLEYNELKANMDLVLFSQAMQHVTRISRITDFPSGNALLIGVGGSGKQSLSKLASFINTYEVEQLVVTSSFGINDLRATLQEIYKKVTKPNASPRVFMMTDSQIKDEKFLIPINDALSQGWIGDLFPKDEVETMVQGLRNEAKGAGVQINDNKALMEYFLDKVKRNMKIILCFSPVGDNFRIKCRKFPGIINSTSIDWFHAWPKDALIDVASRFLQEIELPDENLYSAIAFNMSEVHMSIDEANLRYLKLERRYNYTTPKSFLELISFYKKILNEKRNNIEKQIKRFEQGLDILAMTKSQVEGLEQDLKVKMVEVEKKRAETSVLIDKVAHDNAIAEEEQGEANKIEEVTIKATEAASKLKEEATAALSDAIPKLRAAEEAVKCLEKKHIGEMKSMGSPPPLVYTTARAVMILLNEPNNKVTLNDDDLKVWKKAGVRMNNPIEFLATIQKFDSNNIEDNVINNVSKIMENPKFNEKDVFGASFAASKLCGWVCNIIQYNKIYKEVKPLQDACDAATEEEIQKKQELAAVKERVRVINEKVDALKKQLEEAEDRKAKVEADANMCQAKLNSADKLVKGLSGENKRWGETVKKLKKNTLTVIGDALLAAAFVSYIGAFSAKFRQELWEIKWLPDIRSRAIPTSEEVTPLGILTTEAEMAKWKNQGLPADQMSLENASIISNCSRWPLLIDPQLQGSTWIRGGQIENLVGISINQPKWLNALITAIPMGKFVLIEGIQEELDATLDPLLSRAVKKKGKNYEIEFGGEPVDYDPNFRLYLMTKMYNPHFRPEIAAQCTIINFIVTESGLEDQLLASVVNIEKNELEQIKQELVKKQNDFKVTLDNLENNLLVMLSDADSATILDNKELIDSLEITKKTSNDIAEQNIKAKETEIEINQQREIYRPVANEGALLYFLVISLNVINHMYQYSLESFYLFFFKAINKTTVQDDTRVEELRKNIRFYLFIYIF